ncbi:MAG TPA: type II toxin-antitoxin system Phd/YefM family antitoxin [Firmicutes bacterium]|nr:type II toxin-antitoxin system Phd/YefM family antitoxin [Bacillota bacterium]
MTIIPIRDMRDTTKISEMCHSAEEPIFVTKNGYGDMVVMSMETYEKQLARVDMYTKIAEGKAQADRGELLDGKEELAKLRNKYAG